jgi:hypothetical protein
MLTAKELRALETVFEYMEQDEKRNYEESDRCSPPQAAPPCFLAGPKGLVMDLSPSMDGTWQLGTS